MFELGLKRVIVFPNKVMYYFKVKERGKKGILSIQTLYLVTMLDLGARIRLARTIVLQKQLQILEPFFD